MGEKSTATGEEKSSFSSQMHLEFPGNTGELGRVRSVLREFLAEISAGTHTEPIVLAVDEACTNIIRHALGGESQPVRMECDYSSKNLRIVLRDYGMPCDPSLIKGRDLENVRPGGLGVHIIQSVFDYVEYVPQSDGTRLTLQKIL
jgi:anti-sigma regulatory factor (Ser/Thr protein kinase)